jgi:type IV pilus assembly protein PilN
MIRINLLPHREAKRKLKKTAFIALMVLGAIAGGAVVLAVGGYNARHIAIQEKRNASLKVANLALDKQIAEIATLEQEIAALKARQQAVEDLQGDRNQPVYLFDELVKQTPQGLFLKSFRQEGQRVILTGSAQSQERVAELLRNLTSGSPWLEKPDLTEIRAVPLPQSKTGKKIEDFTMSVAIKRPRDKDLKPGEKAGSKPAAQAGNATATLVPTSTKTSP